MNGNEHQPAQPYGGTLIFLRGTPDSRGGKQLGEKFLTNDAGKVHSGLDNRPAS